MTAARTTKHIIQAYKAVRRAEEQTQAKLEALLETNALYKLFEHEQQHPYFKLADAANNMLIEFEMLVAGVLDWTLSSGTIGEELDRVKARQIVNDEDADDDLDALRLIKPQTMTEAEVADELLAVYNSVSLVWSRSGAAIINSELAMQNGTKNVPRHKETPEVKITKECGAAVREIKKLAKELRELGNCRSTIRREMERKKVIRGLYGQGKDVALEILLK